MIIATVAACLMVLSSVNSFHSTFTGLISATRRPEITRLFGSQECGEGQFDDLVIQSEKPVLVDFYANWCGPCKLVSPIFEQLSDEYPNGDIKFVKVDTDRNEEAVDTFNIQGLPLFGVFVNGIMIKSHSGALGRDALRNFLLGSLENKNVNT